MLLCSIFSKRGLRMRIVILVLLFVAVLFDYKCYKIPNTLTITALISSIVIKGAVAGLSGIGNGLISFLCALCIGLFLYGVKAIGAGDAKLYMAIAWCFTPKEILWIIVVSIFIGAIIGVALLSRDKLLTLTYARHHFHYSIAIFMAVLLQVIVYG